MQQPPAPAAALLLVLLATDSSQTMLLYRTREEASQFLRHRQRRAYQIFEETKQGHLERECVEELCNKEEAREVFENDPETDYFYPAYLGCIRRFGSPYTRNPNFHTCVHNLPNQCSPDPCHKDGTKTCEDLKGGFLCHCRPGWQGERCSIDINECSEQNGGCRQICHNTLGSYRCSCNNGFELMNDNRSCKEMPNYDLHQTGKRGMPGARKQAEEEETCVTSEMLQCFKLPFVRILVPILQSFAEDSPGDVDHLIYSLL